jgi:hypothetical protein
MESVVVFAEYRKEKPWTVKVVNADAGFVKSEVLTAMTMKNIAVWTVTPCGLSPFYA